MKDKLILLLKLIFTTGIIGYLIHNGTLDFSKLDILIEHPSVLIACLSFWLIGAVGISTYRWKLLLKGANLHLSFSKAIELQLTGFFFNTVMPGAVGGDLVKAGYVIKENKDKSKSAVFMTIFLDRLIGMSGIFFIGVIFSLFNLENILTNPSLKMIFFSMLFLITGIAVFFTLALINYKKSDPFEKLFSMNIPGFSLLLNIYNSIRNYRNHKSELIMAFFTSLLLQSGALITFYTVSKYTLNPALPISTIATIFPIGFFTVALPIAPGGLGVGHVAFEELIKLSGSEGGANAFNIYTLTLMFFNLFGCIPYLKMSAGMTKGVDKNDTRIHNS